MAEAAKQFFVGFIHPRTWLAALIGIFAALLTSFALSGLLTGFVSTLPGVGDPAVRAALQGMVTSVFWIMLQSYTYLINAHYEALIVILIGAVVGGLIFGLTAKKERVASKGIIAGLNIAVIYILVTLVLWVFWTGIYTYSVAGIWTLLSAAYNILVGSLLIDIIVSFVIVWLVSALIAILILSMKHD
ncbi:MAG: hypothetical protein WED05_11040 [Candidatus Atabeyarchaeum deiterrae]